MLHTSMEDVHNHQIAKGIVVSNVLYHDAEEHTNASSWQSGQADLAIFNLMLKGSELW